MPTYLDEIVARHRERAARDRRDLAELSERAAGAPPTRGFARSLLARPGASVIAELKRRSPSAGPLAASLDPASVARVYESGGASCLSVLTDGEFFGGSPADLEKARASCEVPILRKDFTVDVLDIYDARGMGADAVLLIVAALSDGELSEFCGTVEELGMDALVEVHDEGELERALAVGADLIGVNQRDLMTFSVDPDRAVRVGRQIPAGIAKIAESGIKTPEQVTTLAREGFDAVLVGEALVRAQSLEDMLGSFVAAGYLERSEHGAF